MLHLSPLEPRRLFSLAHGTDFDPHFNLHISEVSVAAPARAGEAFTVDDDAYLTGYPIGWGRKYVLIDTTTGQQYDQILEDVPLFSPATLSPDIPAGTYRLQETLYGGSATYETDHDDNVATSEPFVVLPFRGNLRFDSLAVTPAVPAGQIVTVTPQLTFVSPVNSDVVGGSVTVELFAQGSDSPAFSASAWAVPGTGDYVLSLPTTLAPGQYRVVASAKASYETDLTDNSAEATLQVLPADPAANYAISSAVFYGDPIPGRSIQVAANFSTAGVASRYARVQFAFLNPATGDLEYAAAPFVASGQLFTLSVPSTLGSYTLRATVNPDASVPESTDADNAATAEVSLLPPPSVTITSIDVPTRADGGSAIAVVPHIQTVRVSQTEFYLKLVVNDSRAKASFTQVVKASDGVPVELDLPSVTDYSTFNISVFFDADHPLPNGVATSADSAYASVLVTNGDLPNLAATSVSYSGTAYPGGSIDAVLGISASRLQAGQDFDLVLDLLPADPGAAPILIYRTSTVAGGLYTIGLPSDLALGDYTLRMTLDGANFIPETDESDNVATVPLQVQTRPASAPVEYYALKSDHLPAITIAAPPDVKPREKVRVYLSQDDVYQKGDALAGTVRASSASDLDLGRLKASKKLSAGQFHIIVLPAAKGAMPTVTSQTITVKEKVRNAALGVQSTSTTSEGLEVRFAVTNTGTVTFNGVPTTLSLLRSKGAKLFSRSKISLSINPGETQYVSVVIPVSAYGVNATASLALKDDRKPDNRVAFTTSAT